VQIFNKHFDGLVPFNGNSNGGGTLLALHQHELSYSIGAPLKENRKKKAPAKSVGHPSPKAHTPEAGLSSGGLSRPQSCVWSQGRLNLRKLCDKDGRCAECSLDKALRESAEQNSAARRRGKIPLTPEGRIAFTRERLQLLPKGERPCLLYANGLIDYKICCKNYECVFCEFDRYFSEQHQVHAVVRPLDVLNVRGFRMPQGYYFHTGHAWVRIEENADVSIGLDDFALHLLGPLDRIEAPLIGNRVEQGRPSIHIGRGNDRSAIIMPVSGVVSTINLALKDNTMLANEDPYARGWILKVHTDNLRQDLRNLLIGGEYVKYLRQETDRLTREIEMIKGQDALPTENSGRDWADQIPDIGWERLVRLFFEG
jgi:glycine cleavage system H lipoate-binding protein